MNKYIKAIYKNQLHRVIHTGSWRASLDSLVILHYLTTGEKTTIEQHLVLPNLHKGI